MYSLYRALFPGPKTEEPLYKRPELTNDTPNNTNIRPTFQIRWKKDADGADIPTIFIFAVVKHTPEEENKYFRKYLNFCKEAINNIVHPWAKQLKEYHDVSDWEMNSLVIGNGYYKNNCDGDYADCMYLHDSVPNGNTILEFNAPICFLQKGDLEVETFKDICEEILQNLYLEYFPNTE